MVRSEPTVKLYRRLGKKRYLKGKYIYEHERIYVPILSEFHHEIKHLLNHELNVNLTEDNDGVFSCLAHAFRSFWQSEIGLYPRSNLRNNAFFELKL